jgi:hypothetical protein
MDYAYIDDILTTSRRGPLPRPRPDGEDDMRGEVQSDNSSRDPALPVFDMGVKRKTYTSSTSSK